MQRYEPRTPRAAIALAALLMSVLTAALLVVAPARMDASPDAATVLAKSRDKPATEVTIDPGRIDVAGIRETTRTVARADRLQDVRADVAREAQRPGHAAR